MEFIVRRSFIAILCSLALLAGTATRVNAAEFHEDPASAQQIYSGISLLMYYSDSLDPILQKNPDATETILSKMPFANVPLELGSPTSDFAKDGIALSQSLDDLFVLWQNENQLLGQYRLDDANKLGKQIADGLPQARNQLAGLTSSVSATGAYLKINTAPPASQMKLAYDDVMNKISQLETMLDLLSRPLLDTGKLTQTLKPTNLILGINPLTAFVGDRVNFTVGLSSQGGPLGGRDVTILLNNSQNVTIKTNDAGHYQGELQIPYWYAPTLQVQAIYYPEDSDIGQYLGSASPVITMDIEFYSDSLVIQASEPAYPGKEAQITGQFYGQVSLNGRTNIMLYLDDNLMTWFAAQIFFIQDVTLDPATAVGKHLVAVFVPPDGRYAPVNASCIVEVTKAATVLDISAHRIAMIPGNLGVTGKLYSVLGPLNDASINLQMNKAGTQVKSLSNGSFSTKLKTAMNLSLLGSQTITIQVVPQEPWNTPLTVTRSVFMINGVVCSILVFVLLALGLYLPRRFQKWAWVYFGKRPRSAETILSAHVEPAREEPSLAATPAKIGTVQEDSGPSGSILGWYRLILRLIQTITRMILKPQQTLREYAADNSQALGPLGKYFTEFTLLVEKLLYSSYKPTPEDVNRSRQLSRTIQGRRQE